MSQQDAFKDVLAHLVGLTSAYEMYARRHYRFGKSEVDAFYSTRLEDAKLAIERGRAAFVEESAEQFEYIDAQNSAIRHEVLRVASELRRYNPAADIHGGKYIHDVWARELDRLIGVAATSPIKDAK